MAAEAALKKIPFNLIFITPAIVSIPALNPMMIEAPVRL
jgi:hypothetical protein